MLTRLIAILGILMALFGVMIAPGMVSRSRRTNLLAIRRLNPDVDDIPWNLTNWIPVGIIDLRRSVPRREWTWMPGFRRVK
jgi:hypothetical protein